MRFAIISKPNAIYPVYRPFTEALAEEYYNRGIGKRDCGKLLDALDPYGRRIGEIYSTDEQGRIWYEEPARTNSPTFGGIAEDLILPVLAIIVVVAVAIAVF